MLYWTLVFLIIALVRLTEALAAAITKLSADGWAKLAAMLVERCAATESAAAGELVSNAGGAGSTPRRWPSPPSGGCGRGV